MWDIGVLTADFSISFFLFAPGCCWDMGLSRLSVFCDFPCIDTHFVSWHYRFLTRRPLPSLDWDLSSSSHPLIHALSYLLFIFAACRYSVVGNSPAFSSLCMTVHYLSRRIPFFRSGLVYANCLLFVCFIIIRSGAIFSFTCFPLFNWLAWRKQSLILWSGLWSIPKERGAQFIRLSWSAGFAFCWVLMKSAGCALWTDLYPSMNR